MQRSRVFGSANINTIANVKTELHAVELFLQIKDADMFELHSNTLYLKRWTAFKSGIVRKANKECVAGFRRNRGTVTFKKHVTDLQVNASKPEEIVFEKGYDYPGEDYFSTPNVPTEEAALAIFKKNDQADMYVYFTDKKIVYVKKYQAFTSNYSVGTYKSGAVCGFRAGRGDKFYENHVRRQSYIFEGTLDDINLIKNANATKVTYYAEQK